MSVGLAARVTCALVLGVALLPATGLTQSRVSVQRAQERLLDGSIFRWDGQQWVQVDGRGVRIAVAGDGTAWVVNAAGGIFRLVNNRFQQVPGIGRDIAVGSNGIPWVIGQDFRVHRWQGDNWEPLQRTGVAIGVERFGTPWVVDPNGGIHFWSGKGFMTHPGTARDIGAGTSVWVIGSDNRLYGITRDGWEPVGGSAVRVSAGAPGTAWVVNDTGGIFRFENGAFHQLPGWAMDIGANNRGEVWVIGEPQRMRRQPARR